MYGFPKRQSIWLSLMSLQGAENLAIFSCCCPPLVLENCCGDPYLRLGRDFSIYSLVINRAIKNLLKMCNFDVKYRNVTLCYKDVGVYDCAAHWL